MLSSIAALPNSFRFSSERELQDYCLSVLRSKGIAAQAEVKCGNVRADIVTGNTVMELKKVLDRNATYQAYGQSMVYQKTLNKAAVWIVGQTPIDPKEYATALTVAREIESGIIKVSFIESDPFWQPASASTANRFSLRFQSVAILSVVTIALMSGLGGITHLRSSNAPVGTSSNVTAAPPAVTLQPQAAPALPIRQLSMCGNGSTANFRQSPTLAENSISGVLMTGEMVQLTGLSTVADGVTWVEVVAPTQSNQVGWIASCFLR